MDSDGVRFVPESASGQFRVEVAAQAPAGAHLVRAYNQQGASALRFLIVSPDPQLEEKEPNDEFAHPQPVDTLPAWINGRLEKAGDVDSYRVSLAAGQTLVASLECFVLGSPVDPVLRVVAPSGVQLAINHDDGRTFDPFVTWTAPAAGSVVVQVFGFAYPANSEVRYTGAANAVYRLRLSRGPWARHTVPLGITRGVPSRVRVVGWNLGTTGAVERVLTAGEPGRAGDFTPQHEPGFENSIPVVVGEGPETVEQEPNDTPANAGLLPVPGAVTGRLDRPADEDRYSFEARKGQTYLIRVDSAALGFPVDAWLRLENTNRQEIARSDDGPTADPSLEWTAAESGRVVAALGSVVHRGGGDHWYRLSLRPASPEARAVVGVNAVTVKAGETNEVAVTVSRLHGHSAPLQVAARDLPPGIECAPVAVPEKGGELKLRLIAVRDAHAFSGPVHLEMSDAGARSTEPVTHPLISAGIDNGVPNGFNHLVVESTDRIWLTVIPPAPPKP
jgi:hypothetical protein